LKILYDLDKYSSNFIAEHILKTIGAEIIGRPGTSEKGVEAIASYFQDHSIVSDSIIQRDGSGLSRYNLITPQQITSMLHYLYYCFACGPELMSVLPVAGADGTLRSRMEDPATKRRVRAKTGTMTHVSTLSGYCITSSGKILIFSIMMKDFPASARHARTIQDRIITVLVEGL
jgi:D-alanyl-D-alanine carboxypeptidase/D-alanyl-D-alanine-endopeptidase (penicillin-binding protein 4)